MGTRVVCQCGKQFQFDDNLAGRTIRCKSCGHEMTVGSSAPPRMPRQRTSAAPTGRNGEEPARMATPIGATSGLQPFPASTYSFATTVGILGLVIGCSRLAALVAQGWELVVIPTSGWLILMHELDSAGYLLFTILVILGSIGQFARATWTWWVLVLFGAGDIILLIASSAILMLRVSASPSVSVHSMLPMGLDVTCGIGLLRLLCDLFMMSAAGGMRSRGSVPSSDC